MICMPRHEELGFLGEIVAGIVDIQLQLQYSTVERITVEVNTDSKLLLLSPPAVRPADLSP